MLQNLDFVVEGDQHAAAQILGGDLLLDAVGATVKAAFTPAGQVQRRLAQSFGRNGARMNRNAANAAAFFNHENRLVQLGRLNGSAASRRSAANDNEIIGIHEAPVHESTVMMSNIEVFQCRMNAVIFASAKKVRTAEVP